MVNAPKYFNNFIKNCGVDPANIRDIDLKFLNENQGKILQLVKWYFVDDEYSIRSAAYRAAQVLKSPNIFEMIENNVCMTKEQKKKVLVQKLGWHIYDQKIRGYEFSNDF